MTARALALIAMSILGGACSSFGGADTPPQTTPGPAPTDDAGPPPITGMAARGLEVSVGESKLTAFIIQGGSLSLPVKLARKEATLGKVTITVRKLPADVTADPLTIAAGALEGTLTLRAKPTTVQGGPTVLDVSAVEEGPQGAGATTKITAFVRGRRGGLDTTFGKGSGLAELYGSGSEAIARDARILSNGSILIVSKVLNQIVLSRFTPAGDLDTTFAGGGTTILGGTPGSVRLDVWEPANPADGVIYLVDTHPTLPKLFRRTLDGAADKKFNGTGTVTVDDGIASTASAAGVVALPGGKALVLLGHSLTGEFTVTRWNADGSRDAGYGTGGTCQPAGGAGMLARASGGIFVSTAAGVQGCTAMGALDTTIGSSPSYSAPIGAGASEFASTPDGGLAFLETAATYASWSRASAALQKDVTIGLLGDVGTTLKSPATFLVQPDGGVLVGAGVASAFTVLRYTSKGKLDTDFGTAGTASFDVGGVATLAKLVAQPDGRVLALGKTDNGFDAVAVRFWP